MNVPARSDEFALRASCLDPCRCGADTSRDLAGPMGGPTAGSRAGYNIPLLDGNVMPIEPHSESSRPHLTFQGQIRRNGGKSLLVMKFGGTSVGDASCIEKV